MAENPSFSFVRRTDGLHLLPSAGGAVVGSFGKPEDAVNVYISDGKPIPIPKPTMTVDEFRNWRNGIEAKGRTVTMIDDRFKKVTV